MLDIMDKHGRVVAVLLDDGTVIKKDKTDDDIDVLIKERLAKLEKEGKKK